MITPPTMTWEQVKHASDEELVAVYMQDGMAREKADAFAAEIRRGLRGGIVE